MDTQEFEQKRLRSYARHFLSLDGLIYLPENRAETERVFCVSGFVVSVRSEWFFITAGHVFDEVKEAREQGQVIENWSFDCSNSIDAKDNYPTYFDLDSAGPIFRYNPQSGFDYAFIRIRAFSLTRRNLEANGLTALSEQAWRQWLAFDYDEYFLLGIPRESVAYNRAMGIVEKVLVVAPMDRLEPEELPDDIPPKEGLFFARLHDIPDDAVNCPQSIKGMSGGPIFGLKHEEDDSRYWAIAIQSWWEKDSGIIRACYLRILCDALDKWLQKTEEVEN